MLKITQVSLYPFGGSVADLLYKFHFRASLTLLSFARWRRYRADSTLLWRTLVLSHLVIVEILRGGPWA